MALEIEAPPLPACVTSGASLNLSLVSSRSGSGLRDRVGAQGVMVWLSFLLPCLSVSPGRPEQVSRCGASTGLFP